MAPAHPVERGLQACRGHIAVEPQDGLAGFVEEQQAGGELDFQRRAIGFFRIGLAVKTNDLAIAPQIDCNVEFSLAWLRFRAAKQIALHQRCAIRAVVW
jgi:hypothetical protein